MKTYTKFLINLFNISFLKIFGIFFVIIFILNILEQKSPDRTKLERQKNNLKIHFKTVLEGINSLII